MRQLTIRGFGKDLEKAIRRIAREEGLSLNQAALKFMRAGAGVEGEPQKRVLGSSLDWFIGRWTEGEERAFLRSVEWLERIDKELWK